MYYTASNWMGARQIQVLAYRNVWPKPARLHNLGTADASWAQLGNLLNDGSRSDVSLRPGEIFFCRIAELLLLISCFGNPCLLACIGNSFHECLSTFRSGYFPGENLSKHHVLAVNGASGILILLNDCSLQGDPGERASGARVGQDLCVHLPIRTCGRMTSDRTCCHRSFASQGKLAGQ